MGKTNALSQQKRAQLLTTALTIAGSDSGGCAGIQADLKTFGALAVHGASVITALTAQNTRGVEATLTVPAHFVSQQMDAVCSDLQVAAAKSGMLPSPEIVELVASLIRDWKIEKFVVDPVMVATSGDSLISEDAVETIRQVLLPSALLVTPNRLEAEILSGRSLEGESAISAAAGEILELGCRAVLIKGGHAKDARESTDYLCTATGETVLSGPRFPTPHTHGSGCTLSAAITAYLARGFPLEKSCRLAKRYVSEAIRNSLNVGRGPGSLGHFHRLWSLSDESDSPPQEEENSSEK